MRKDLGNIFEGWWFFCYVFTHCWLLPWRTKLKLTPCTKLADTKWKTSKTALKTDQQSWTIFQLAFLQFMYLSSPHCWVRRNSRESTNFHFGPVEGKEVSQDRERRGKLHRCIQTAIDSARRDWSSARRDWRLFFQTFQPSFVISWPISTNEPSLESLKSQQSDGAIFVPVSPRERTIAPFLRRVLTLSAQFPRIRTCSSQINLYRGEIAVIKLVIVVQHPALCWQECRLPVQKKTPWSLSYSQRQVCSFLMEFGLHVTVNVNKTSVVNAEIRSAERKEGSTGAFCFWRASRR